MPFPDQACAICETQFTPRRRTDKTCTLDCQIQWRRKLSREKAARHYKPRPPRPDAVCLSCGTSIATPRTGPKPQWCERCKANKEHDRARRRVAVRRCHKCQQPVPDVSRKPGVAVCDGCRVDPRKSRTAHEQRRRLRKYGLTQEQYDKLELAQGGRCPGCNTDDPGPKGWCIDHCHTSGRVRALLCSRCNTILGLADENSATLRALANFAEQHSEMKI